MMSFVKRIVPFFLAFALGLFVASFFVSISLPKFDRFERRGYYRHSEYSCPMRYEMERQRLENLRLHEQMQLNQNFNNFDVDAVPAPPLPPPPPSRVR